MTTKSAFTEKEWKLLLQAPSMAGMYITLASPSFTDSVKESMAVANKIADAARAGSGPELTLSLVEEFKSFSNVRAMQPKFESHDPEAIKAEALASLREATAAVNQQASADESQEYRKWVYDIAVAAAEAAKEGDILGIGGERVNEAERVALEEIASALDLNR